ncbi:hypothetical protein [Actinomadura sp. 6N118]|uniref:hypothetical protein n=1 Tax=Actinomadura sp. 6N118 TaxID=3375151 RepID=UPI003791BE6B
MYDPASRYAGLAMLTVTLPDGTTRVMSAPRAAPAGPTAGPYDIGPGQRLDLLAGGLLGDTTLWWRIADANPSADAARLEEPGGTIQLPGG